MDNQTYNRYILAVNKTGNLTVAAKELGISQPALSSGLNLLEEKLGFKMFDRKQKPIVPTKEGRIYIEYINQQELLEKECMRKISDISGEGIARISVGGSMVYTQSLISNSLNEFEKLYPECEFVIHTDSLPQLIEMVSSGELDCIVSTSANLPDSFAKEELYHEQLYVCVPKSWDIRCNTEDDGQIFKVLNGCDGIFLPDNFPLQKIVNKFFEANNIKLKRKLVVDQVAIGLSLAARGKGIAIATQTAFLDSNIAQSLDLYPLPQEYFDRTIYISYNKDRYVSKLCSDYMAILKNTYGGIS